MQGRDLCLWAEVDPLSGEQNVAIHVYGTGNPLDYEHERYTYIGTVVQVIDHYPDQTSLVWHVYYEELPDAD